ncbi:MAG: DNA-binding protein [Sulfobacillus benefaciens]|uniref:DNA-binding protein n=1 Tax=Sulfobacillus benefaciens TaxID=453960 RepID=A0A2T2WYQ4_9FIRM|nr:MAG: DNA-binding protein [Sulfobacillus benefaciens]
MGKYLTVEEVAAQLQVTPRTIQRWIRIEGLPAIKLARAVRVDADDLVQWLELRKIRGDQPDA